MCTDSAVREDVAVDEDVEHSHVQHIVKLPMGVANYTHSRAIFHRAHLWHLHDITLNWQQSHQARCTGVHAGNVASFRLCQTWCACCHAPITCCRLRVMDNNVTGTTDAHIEDCRFVSQKHTYGLQKLYSSVCRQSILYCIDSLP